MITVLETQYDTAKEFKLHKKLNNYIYLDKTPFCMLFSEDTHRHTNTHKNPCDMLLEDCSYLLWCMLKILKLRFGL